MSKIKKAIFPVAGFGTRFLPATKSIPKEMMPIVDTPLIEYAVREAIKAGVTEIIFITSPFKKAIEHTLALTLHFKNCLEILAKAMSFLKFSLKNLKILLLNI